MAKVILKSQKVKVNGLATFDMGDLTTITNNSCLIGFDAFSLTFGESDHHVQNIGITLENVTVPKENKIKVRVNAVLCDTSGNTINATESFVNVLLYAIDPVSKTGDEYSAMNDFKVSFDDLITLMPKDHHVAEVSANSNTGKTAILDGSGHNGTGKATANKIRLASGAQTIRAQNWPSTESQSTSLTTDGDKKEAFFIQSFKIAMNGGDHHLRTIGLKTSYDKAGEPKVTYTLEDESKNHADDSCCFTDGVLLSNTN